ncbi:MAG: SGNH/GDSL hydrolase family protein [bacterium]
MSRIVYVAFGDSITDGYGVSGGFVHHLTRWLKENLPDRNLEVIKSGWSGENTRDGLYRVDREVISRDPHIATINYGVNDAFSGVSVGEFEKNMEEMVTRIKEGGCLRIVLLSSEVIPDIWAEREVLPYWDAMAKAAEKGGAVYADVNGWWSRVLSDGRSEHDLIIPGDLHPNAEGHRVIADAVIDAFEKNRVLEGL